MLVEGTIVMMDLDRFGEMTVERGWDEYKPNIVTGTLTMLVERLASRWGAVVLYGLDKVRGTEEAVLEVPGVEPRMLKEDLREIYWEIRRLGACITIVAVKGFVGGRAPGGRRNAYEGSSDRRRAKRILSSLKRRGGCRIYVE